MGEAKAENIALLSLLWSLAIASGLAIEI